MSSANVIARGKSNNFKVHCVGKLDPGNRDQRMQLHNEMSSINTAVPQPLPSLSSSPIEEDLTRARASWHEEDSSDSESSVERRKKGKERQAETEYPDGSSDALQDTSTGGEVYPPMNDDAAETRRVEEHLKRWELAERLRRKAARESSSNAPSASLVGGVTRRASQLWSSKRQRPPSRSGLGNHTALRSRESVDAIPLDGIPASAPPSPTRDENHPSNPFSNPSAPQSPFDDSQQQTALMTPSSDLPPEDEYAVPEQPALIPASAPVRPPPPQPLGLPKPRTPPPPIDSPHTNRPPQAHPPPVAARTSPGSEGETRWWHDWLCGCGEGPDRGGDNQAGRTNPFE